ncbi:MAG TPA: hypothetical protein DCX97_04150 [Alistipes sp.]|nr:hypothetical protein [Alistipes sp.]
MRFRFQQRYERIERIISPRTQYGHDCCRTLYLSDPAGKQGANGKTAGNNRKQSEGVNNPPIRVLYLYGRTETGVHGEYGTRGETAYV